eukprot:366122-Chlamydomonas_euryale.AAC.8
MQSVHPGRNLECTPDEFRNCTPDEFRNCTPDEFRDCTPDEFRNCPKQRVAVKSKLCGLRPLAGNIS